MNEAEYLVVKNRTLLMAMQSLLSDTLESETGEYGLTTMERRIIGGGIAHALDSCKEKMPTIKGPIDPFCGWEPSS